MKIDLNSPVEVWRIDAPNTGFPSCELPLFNLSGQQVVSVEVTLTLLDPDGQEITRITHRAHGLTGAPMRTFSMQHLAPRQRATDGVHAEQPAPQHRAE